MSTPALLRKPVVRKLLNLPPVEGEAAAKKARVERAQDEPMSAAEESPALRYAGWTTENETGMRAATRKAGRWFLWVVAGLVFLLGLRTLLMPAATDPGPVSHAPATREGFPSDQARAIAQRWTTAYLTLDSDSDGAQRESHLARDTDPTVDLTQAWDGSGDEAVKVVIPGAVDPHGHDRATVTVYALVETGTSGQKTPAKTPSPTTKPKPSKPPKDHKGKKHKKASKAAYTGGATVQNAAAPVRLSAATTAEGGHWLALAIPMGWDGQRVVVTGLPAFVALPPAEQAHHRGQGTPEEAVRLTGESRDAAVAFFTAYAGQSEAAVQAATAPGASIAPLGGTVTFHELADWTVFKPTARATPKATGRHGSPRRMAEATVVWDVNGAQLTQSYTVRLEAVSSTAGKAWRVAAVAADTDPTQQ